MLFQRFLNLIDDTVVGKFVARKEELIEQLDPDRIYVENVRSFFGIPSAAARFLCGLAVRDGVFVPWLGLMCPNCERIVLSARSEDEIPSKLLCEVCEMNGCERYEFDRSELKTIVFYKLND
jgi:hypothetical protein